MLFDKVINHLLTEAAIIPNSAAVDACYNVIDLAVKHHLSEFHITFPKTEKEIKSVIKLFTVTLKGEPFNKYLKQFCRKLKLKQIVGVTLTYNTIDEGMMAYCDDNTIELTKTSLYYYFKLDHTEVFKQSINHELIHLEQNKRRSNKMEGSPDDNTEYYNNRTEIMTQASDFIGGIVFDKRRKMKDGTSKFPSESIYDCLLRVLKNSEAFKTLGIHEDGPFKYMSPQSKQTFLKYAYQYALQYKDAK